MKKAKFDPAAWAKSKKNSSPGNRCTICSNKDVSDVVALISAMRDRGETRVTYVEIADMLLEQYDFKTLPGTISRHIKLHTKRDASGSKTD